jgi:hypothetical protein
MACYGLGMRQPANGCNVRAKRLTHWLLTSSRRLQPRCLFSLPTGWIGWRSQRLTCGKRVPFALLTRADQGGTHPGPAGECQSHRRQKIPTTKGGSDATCPLVSVLHSASHLLDVHMRTNEQPTRHRACIGESLDGTILRSASHRLISKGEIHILRDEASLFSN